MSKKIAFLFLYQFNDNSFFVPERPHVAQIDAYFLEQRSTPTHDIFKIYNICNSQLRKLSISATIINGGIGRLSTVVFTSPESVCARASDKILNLYLNQSDNYSLASDIK